MAILINESWNYQLVKNQDKYVLSVMCGSVALYEVEKELTDAQIKEFNEKGKAYIDELVEMIRSRKVKW